VAPQFQGQAPDALARSQQLLDGARPGPAEYPALGPRRVSLGLCTSCCWTVRAPARRIPCSRVPVAERATERCCMPATSRFRSHGQG